MDEQSTTATDSPLSSLLGNLLNNPALLSGIGEMLGNTAEHSSPGSSPSDGLSKVLSDPSLMAKLPQIMAMLQPMLADTPAQPQTSEAEKAIPAPSEATPAMAHAIPQAPRRDCRDDLLLALKPFLSPARCEAVDTIIRLSKLGAVLKHLQ